MTTNAVLNNAEQRVDAAKAAAQHRQHDIVKTMREEIGVRHYTEAKEQLPILEKFIAKEVRPYVDRLTRLSHHAPVPLPVYISAQVRELQDTCASGVDWVRAGIEEYDRLVPPFVPDTQRLDLTRRAVEVDSLRRRLMNWNGRESRLRDLMANINNYIETTGWPAAQPPAAA